MPEMTIDEMIEQVEQGQKRIFEPSLVEPAQEQYFRVWQNWDYRPGRLEWINKPAFESAPRLATRFTNGRPVTSLPRPDVAFKGPAKDVVDFYDLSKDAPFISDALFRLIDEVDPGSLDSLEFSVRARGGDLPFHAVMPRRVLKAIDPRRTKVVVEDENYAGTYIRRIRFPDGIIFDNEALTGVTSFSDIDAGGWYWSKGLIEMAEKRGIRGLYAQSVASSQPRDVARL